GSSCSRCFTWCNPGGLAMSEKHDDHGGHAGPDIKTYLVIFGALSGFTLVSFVANFFAIHGYISHFFSFVIILTVAIVKATLVAMYFMHLKFEWGKLYFLIFPVLILAVMMALVFLPDIVLAWHHYYRSVLVYRFALAVRARTDKSRRGSYAPFRCGAFRPGPACRP